MSDTELLEKVEIKLEAARNSGVSSRRGYLIEAIKYAQQINNFNIML